MLGTQWPHYLETVETGAGTALLLAPLQGRTANVIVRLLRPNWSHLLSIIRNLICNSAGGNQPTSRLGNAGMPAAPLLLIPTLLLGLTLVLHRITCSVPALTGCLSHPAEQHTALPGGGGGAGLPPGRIPECYSALLTGRLIGL